MTENTLDQYMNWGELSPRASDACIPISQVAVDSRQVTPATLYFALPGARVDGHDFLEQASKKGAVAAVVTHSYAGPSYGMRLIPVANTLLSLQAMAAASLNARVIAVTGSVGKTTTKEFIHSLLKGSVSVAASPGNANSQIGLPLSLLNGPRDVDYLVQEMGISEPGEMDSLVQIAAPEIALITYVGLTHAEGLGGLEAIAKEKLRIFSHPSTRVKIAWKGTPVAFEGLSFDLVDSEADYGMEFLEAGCRVREGALWSPLLPVELPGRHFYHDLLAAIAVARQLGLSWDSIADACKGLELPERRFQRQEIAGITVINDAYNASEPSMVAALDSFPEGRRIAVLGEMRELGAFTKEVHRRVYEHAMRRVDQLFLVGDLWEGCYESSGRCSWVLEKEALWECLELEAGDVLLVKGSCGLALWTIVQQLERRYGALSH